MYNTKKLLLPLSLLLMLCACSEGKSTSAGIAAYSEAAQKASEAENSEDLLEISYRLHLQLQGMPAVDNSSLAKSRLEFETAVKEKEIEFYSKKSKRK